MDAYELAKQVMIDCGVTILLETPSSLYVINKHGVRDVLVPEAEHLMAYVHGYEVSS